MKYLFFLLLSLSLYSATAAAMPDGPIPFEKFFKSSMKVTPGEFTVYQDGSNYFLEIPVTSFNQDILVLGDIARGLANTIAESSGVIRFSKGINNNLNVTRAVDNNKVALSVKPGLKPVVTNLTLSPVSFVVPIAAAGKNNQSFIIDITQQLMRGGDLFSFKDFDGLSNSDPDRSGVQYVKASGKSMVFTVLRTQTNQGASLTGGKNGDAAVSYILQLVIQRLSPPMKARTADQRIGFAQVDGNQADRDQLDGIKAQKNIIKWNLTVKLADAKRYAAGELVEPVKPVRVFIDPTTPSLFVPYIQQAVVQWNNAFHQAGFKNALVIATDENENYLSAGKILIRWANAGAEVMTNLVTDPRTGEIIAAKMNIGDNVCNELLTSYFAQCGFKDPRVREDLYHPQVRAEIMRWKVAQSLGSLLGMMPNLQGSAAYTTDQIRSADWLQNHSFSSSVTDDMPFNFVVQPEDQVAVADLMPRVGAYDQMAIGWAYRIFSDAAKEKKVLDAIGVSNPELLYLEKNERDPFTRQADLSSSQLEASTLGMKNINLFYPQLENITAAMDDEDWTNFKAISSAFQKNYLQYGENVASYIGGLSVRPIKKGYNDVAVVYTSKQDQQKALSLLNAWFFSGVPSWVQSKNINTWNNEFDVSKLQYMTQSLLRKMISPAVVNNLVQTEDELGKEAFTTSDLFNALDHYVFKDFSTDTKVDAYTMQMQANFMFDLSDAVVNNRNNETMSSYNEVIYSYFVRTMEHFGQLAQRHKDQDTKAQYQLVKWKIDKL